jgi:hypothetical protein
VFILIIKELMASFIFAIRKPSNFRFAFEIKYKNQVEPVEWYVVRSLVLKVDCKSFVSFKSCCLIYVESDEGFFNGMCIQSDGHVLKMSVCRLVGADAESNVVAIILECLRTERKLGRRPNMINIITFLCKNVERNQLSSKTFWKYLAWKVYLHTNICM